MGKREWNKLKFWFEKEHGITDLERYMGVGGYLFLKGDQELDGQEKQDFNDILMQITADPNSVKDTYARLKKQWEWYRGEGSSGVGNTLMDMYSDSGGDLDHKLDVLDELMENPARKDGEGDWYDTSSGKADKKSVEWAKFDKYTTLLDEMAGIYKDQRDTLVDGICSVVTTVAAIVATIVTMGGAAAIWAVAITAAAAAASILVKATVKGDSYGTNEALADVGKAAAEVVTGLVTLGIANGKFKAVGEFFEGLAEAGMAKKMIGEMLKSVATELPAALIDPATWADEDKLLAIFGSLTFKVGVGSVGGVLNEKAMDGFEGTAGKFMKSISESVVDVSSDLSALQGDNWAMDVMSGSIKKFGNKYIGGKMAANAANKLNEKTTLSMKDLERFQNMSKDAAEAISKKLLPQHHIQAFKAAPKKVPEPTFSGAQLDLFDHKKAKAIGGKKENQNPNTNSQATKPDTDPDQLTMDFGSDGAESTVQTPKKVKTAASVKEKAKSVHQNTVKGQGTPALLQDVSAPGVAEKLQKIKGIGPALSAAIVNHGGPFESPADLQAVHQNIGEKLAKKVWEEL